MTDSNNVLETSEDNCLKSTKKWEIFCKTSNIILSVVYVLFGWIFGFLGLMFFSLGLPDAPFTAVCYFLAVLLLSLTPYFLYSRYCFVRYFKKKEGFSGFVLDSVPSFCHIGRFCSFVFPFNYLKATRKKPISKSV